MKQWLEDFMRSWLGLNRTDATLHEFQRITRSRFGSLEATADLHAQNGTAADERITVLESKAMFRGPDGRLIKK